MFISILETSYFGLWWNKFYMWQVFSHSTKAVIGSFSTGFDILRIVVSNDFIFTATKCGIIEVWLKERVARVASIKMSGGEHAKITSLTSDMDGGMLYAGSSDGKIEVRQLSITNLIIFTEKRNTSPVITHCLWDMIAGLGSGLGEFCCKNVSLVLFVKQL